MNLRVLKITFKSKWLDTLNDYIYSCCGIIDF